MVKRTLLCLIPLLLIITACSAAATPTLQNTPTEFVEPTLEATSATEEATQAPTEESTATVEVQATPTYAPGDWMNLPVIPTLSPAMIEVYERGLADGREPHRFSKIGDCQNINTYFLDMFDGGTYSLGEDYAYLQATLDYFAGSWGRKSMAVKGGLNASAVQNTMWTSLVETYTEQYDICRKGETPLVCELRDNNPSFAIISLEESWVGSLDTYDTNMRQIVDYVLSLNIVPILATRSELLTQDRQMNDIVVKIAEDYDLPLWNFGAAAAKLPNAGLMVDGDGFHLSRIETQSQALFDDPETMQMGFTWRNLTALQTLDSILHSLGALQ